MRKSCQGNPTLHVIKTPLNIYLLALPTEQFRLAVIQVQVQRDVGKNFSECTVAVSATIIHMGALYVALGTYVNGPVVAPQPQGPLLATSGTPVDTSTHPPSAQTPHAAATAP